MWLNCLAVPDEATSSTGWHSRLGKQNIVAT
jgi:hypothetical protein